MYCTLKIPVSSYVDSNADVTDVQYNVEISVDNYIKLVNTSRGSDIFTIQNTTLIDEFVGDMYTLHDDDHDVLLTYFSHHITGSINLTVKYGVDIDKVSLTIQGDTPWRRLTEPITEHIGWTLNLPSQFNRIRDVVSHRLNIVESFLYTYTIINNISNTISVSIYDDKIDYNFGNMDDNNREANLSDDYKGVLQYFMSWQRSNDGFTIRIIEDVNFNEASITINGDTPWRTDTEQEGVSVGGDPVIKPFFGSGYKVKLPDLPGHMYRLLQGGGVTINTEIMACPTDKASFLKTRPVLFSDQKIVEGTYIGKIWIDVKDLSFQHTIDLSKGIGCVECNLPDGACWDGDLTDGEIKQGVDPDYKCKYKQRVMSVGGGVMKFVVRIYKHPQVQNEFQVLRCNIDPSVHDGLLIRNYKPKLFFLNDLCDTRMLSKHKKNSNPLTFRHPVVKNQVIMKCA